MTAVARSEVEGVWFVVARSHVLERHGAAALEAIAERLDPVDRFAVQDPIASEWYPEETLQRALAAAWEVLAERDGERFLRFVEDCTERGVTRFFSVLIQLSTTAFILSKVPFLWERVRRGSARVQVVPIDGGSEIRHSGFPYFGDELYRLLTVGSLRAVVRRCTGEEPQVEITSFGRDHCTVAVLHD